MAVVGTWTGLEAKVLRLAGRMTVQTFAERLGVAVRTVAYWESRGASITPQAEMQAALDTLLSRGDADAQARFHLLLSKAHSPPGQPAVPAPTSQALAAALSERSSVDLVAIAHLREKIHELDERYDRSPSTSLLAEAGQQLGQVAILRSQATTGRIHRALSAVEAEAATLMGQLVWDASQRRDHVTARVYFARAVRAAEQIDDRAAEALALLRTSFVALYGEKDPRAGLGLATLAAETARGASTVLAGQAVLHIAEAHAMLGEQHDCERALSLAESLIDHVEVTDPCIELFAPTQHGRLAGSCYLFLGKTSRAIPILRGSVNVLRQGSKSHAIALANLALAHIRQREFDEAVRSLHKAIDVVELTRGGGGLNIVFQAGRELEPWSRSPVVSGVHDRLLALMTAA